MTTGALSRPARTVPISERLPDGLMEPGAFPHHPDAVELRETHVSWVFLAGDRAYKVKKPVVLPFLDYGTPARRRAACAEEVRVNRRLAPSIYVGVVSLVPRGYDGLVVAPEHDPRAVEYAVEMCRYAEDRTLAAILADGRATRSGLAAIGEGLARLHASRAPARASDGTDRLFAVVDETLGTLRRAGTGVIEPARVAALARFARSAVAGLGARLREREAAGLVREGHGDLRAEHVLVGEPLRLVDAVDFDPALRLTDVAYDLAFLVMDVARRDEALARALVRGYAAGGGDPGDRRLLAFLVVVRALVRAKVDLLRAAQLQGPERDRIEQRAVEHVALAERFAWRARLPRIVCVAGLAASGKSTFAAALGAASGLPVLSSDFVRKSRAGLRPTEHAAAAYYGRDVSREVYGALGREAAAAVHSDGGAIVDATFRRPDDTVAFQSASHATAGARWIVCRAPADVMLERARWRAAKDSTPSDADPAVVAAQIARHSGRLRVPGTPLAELETVEAVPRLLDRLAASLDARLALGSNDEPEASR
jgi:aminoglycoside phosphotransferase family enzyme/predicted kinase